MSHVHCMLSQLECTISSLDVSNRGSRLAAIQITTGSQRFQIARLESPGQKPFESLFRLYYFTFLLKKKYIYIYMYIYRFQIREI